MSIKKAILIVGIAICLLVGGHEAYKYYQEHQPIAEVGECLEVQAPPYGALKIYVMENDNANMVTTGVIEVEAFGTILQFPVKASYQELRDAGAKKVSCE